MKMQAEYKTIFILGSLAFLSLQVLKAETACCGDAQYDSSVEDCCGGVVVPIGHCCSGQEFDPETEECCGGTIVEKGRCCNNRPLEEGFECCNELTPPSPYNPETTCCTSSALYAKGTMLPEDITKCPNRVANPNYHPDSNGCGTPGWEYIVPQTDVTLTVSFTECCNTHDICYQICNAVRADCDTGFFNCLHGACYAQIPPVLAIIGIPLCATRAGIYYLAVDVGAEAGFNDAQRRACQCCP
jgi:secretory phospholipase A2